MSTDGKTHPYNAQKPMSRDWKIPPRYLRSKLTKKNDTLCSEGEIFLFPPFLLSSAKTEPIKKYGVSRGTCEVYSSTAYTSRHTDLLLLVVVLVVVVFVRIIIPTSKKHRDLRRRIQFKIIFLQFFSIHVPTAYPNYVLGGTNVRHYKHEHKEKGR
jgi:hypothetical protein